MKKSLVTILATVFLCLLFIASAQSALPYRYVKVEGRQLMVDFDENGIYEPYTIKGAGYSAFPIGRFPSDWGYFIPGDPRPDNILDDPAILNRDFALLRDMHSNTIRLWKGNDTQDGLRYPVKLTQNTLDLAESYGIKIIAGFWIDTTPGQGSGCINGVPVYKAPAFLDPSNPQYTYQRVNIIFKFKAYVEQFKDSPAILFWAIGNENNYAIPYDNIPPTYLPAWYSLVNQMAYEAHLSEGATYHPVALVNGDLKYIGDPSVGASDALMPFLDIWGANTYRPNSSFGNLFVDYAAKSSKPLWISEYGVDAYQTTSYFVRPDGFGDADAGYENQTAQALWIGKLWDEMVKNNSVCVGGTVMEYSDEWWKPYEWIDGGARNDQHNQFGYGPQDTSCPRDGIADWIPPAPDQFFNEEWFGIMSVNFGAPFTPDVMTPREVYYSLQKRFNCSGATKYYAGPDNGKSCDGTDACCYNSTMKARNGYCTFRCSGGGCFLAGTLILMADGSSKPIEEIKVGDLVKSVDQKDDFIANKVTKLFVHPQTQGYLLVETPDGKKLQVTPEHRVKSGKDYKPMGELTINSPLTLLKDGQLIETKITAMRKIETTQTVYNFEVENTHTYFADHYLVHNRKQIPYMMPAE